MSLFRHRLKIVENQIRSIFGELQKLLARIVTIETDISNIIPTTSPEIIIQSESDFPAPVAGIITLVDNQLYRIIGDVTITNKINCNGATITGRDRIIDGLVSSATSSELFTGSKTTVLKNLTLTITGASSKLFNLVGAAPEFLYIQDCNLQDNVDTGLVDGFLAVQIINTTNQNYAAGLVLNNITQIDLRGFSIVPGTASTLLTISGFSAIVQILGSAFNVGVRQVGLDISGLTTFLYGLIGAGTVFDGVGTYVSAPISTDSGIFPMNWEVGAQGLNTEKDVVSEGQLSFSTAVETVISAVDTPIKCLGTTTLGASLLRVDDDGGTNNRLKYLGATNKKFTVEIHISLTAANNNKIFTFYIAKNGVIISPSAIRRFVSTGSDIGALGLNWVVDLGTDDFVELWVENNTDSTNCTIEYCTMTIS